MILSPKSAPFHVHSAKDDNVGALWLRTQINLADGRYLPFMSLEVNYNHGYNHLVYYRFGHAGWTVVSEYVEKSEMTFIVFDLNHKTLLEKLDLNVTYSDKTLESPWIEYAHK
jgi:hypothetical protein